MDAIERRVFMKATAISGIALSIGGAQRLLTVNEAHAQGASPRAAAWPNKRLIDLLKIEHPIVQAPMGGHVTPDMTVAVSGAGGLGSFPCTARTPAQVREEVTKMRTRIGRPINLNFFCHASCCGMKRMRRFGESAWPRIMRSLVSTLLRRPLSPHSARKCVML
jgi:hypothetical protein